MLVNLCNNNAYHIVYCMNIVSILSWKTCVWSFCHLDSKKSLKIPKWQSESIYRRTDNTMAKRKSTKGQTTIYKTKICLNNFSSVLILDFSFFSSDTSTFSSSSESNSLFDTETNDSKMIKEILIIIAVNVRFYNSRYFNMHCKNYFNIR